MDAPVSSTDLEHRGKGFPFFRQVVEQSRRGRLLILSRNGRFLYEKGGKPRAEPLHSPLNGTLVEWDIWV